MLIITNDTKYYYMMLICTAKREIFTVNQHGQLLIHCFVTGDAVGWGSC